jgi:hypothetical protein
MTATEKAKLDKLYAAHPGIGRVLLARKAGLSENRVKTYLRHAKGTHAPVRTAQAAPIAPSKAGRSLAEFRAAYDKSTIVPGRVKAAIKALGAGGWEYEVQFARNAGVSLADLAAFRDEFASHIVQLKEGRRAWAGSAKAAQQMREML